MAAQHRAAARSISLSADEETLSIVLADRHRLGQLLDNLINNAVAYTPAGGDVVVSSGRGHGGGWIAVADNGSGIAPEFRDRLFQPALAAQGDAHAVEHIGVIGRKNKPRLVARYRFVETALLLQYIAKVAMHRSSRGDGDGPAHQFKRARAIAALVGE